MSKALNRLDYTISKQRDRIEHINHIINHMDEQQYVINPYELEKITDYILFSPDSKPLVKKTKYRFYTENVLKNKLKKEKSLEEFINRNENFDEDTVGEVINFLERNNSNFRSEARQKIYNNDLHDKSLSVISEYEKFISLLKAKIEHIKKTSGNKKLIYLYSKHIGLCRQDQLISKDIIKGTIYFKKAYLSSNNVNYLDHFNFNNREAIKALLKIRKPSIFSDIGIILQDLEGLINKLDIKNNEKDMLNMWRYKDWTETMIANKLGMKQPNVHRKLNRIIKKIMDKYEEEYLDFVNFNYCKGAYKKCPKCNETKLLHHFGKCHSRGDGLHVYCKKCQTK